MVLGKLGVFELEGLVLFEFGEVEGLEVLGDCLVELLAGEVGGVGG